MSILDDAIREHLALKRAHGANENELKKLEDEAFGPPQRPDQADPFAEAPTEFLVAPADTAAAEPEIADESERSGRRPPNITDLQEGPPPEPEKDAAADSRVADETAAEVPEGEIAPAPAEGTPVADVAPAPEEHPAGELALPIDETGPIEESGSSEGPSASDAGPNTAERHAIADQPTEMFDVQSELSADTSANPATPIPPEPESSELQIEGPDAELAGAPPPEADPGPATDEDFFDEQRLSDELDQALEAPITDEEELPAFDDARPVTDEFGPATDEHAVPNTEEGTAIYNVETDEEDDYSEPRAAGGPAVPVDAEEGGERPELDPDTDHDDALENTPQFLEDRPEDDDLWFEQKPPKDFDFDD